MIEIANSSLLKSQAYINGEWIDADNNFDILNPYNGETISTVSDCGVVQTKLAIDSASIAFDKWKKHTAEYRSNLLHKWASLLEENQEDLARILTMEQGKPLTESKGEISYGASFIRWFAEEGRRTYGETIPAHLEDKRIITLRQPVGVVGIITPWNFPNAMIARKVGPALAAGCTVVIKPAESTPLSALAIAHLAEEAGIPAGVINVLPASRPATVGDELTMNPKVRKISFTGSTAVGKLLLRQSADTVKKVSMELGGNAPFIVFEDADLEKAVIGAVASKYRNSGQTCVCANRIYVHDSIAEEFIEKLRLENDKLISGDGLDNDTQVGPLINQEARDFIDDLIDDARSKGAAIHSSGNGRTDGLFYPPTLATELSHEMKIHTNEIFGPVSAVYTFSEEKEVIDMANNTRYGLASYFYGKDSSRIWRVAEALEYGIVGINTGLISTAVAPFGGVKESGLGREGSKHGIDEYLEIKYLCWDIS